jgi:hypothetical protein
VKTPKEICGLKKLQIVNLLYIPTSVPGIPNALEPMRIRGSVPLIKNRTWILLFSLFACDRKNNNGSIREASVVDPHHFDGDPDADPDSTYHADAVMDADPDPSLKIGSNP